MIQNKRQNELQKDYIQFANLGVVAGENVIARGHTSISSDHTVISTSYRHTSPD